MYIKSKMSFLLVALLVSPLALADCPPEKPAQWLDNQCYSCQDVKPIMAKYIQQQQGSINLSEMNSFIEMMNVVAQIKEVCPDEEELKRREAEEKRRQEMSSIDEKCPPERPLKDDRGLCRTCDDPMPFEMDFADLPQCDTLCSADNQTTQRYRVNQYCLPKKCPDDKPLMDATGNCISCDDEEKSIAVVDGCLKCSNRYIFGYWGRNHLQGNSCTLKDNTFNAKKYTQFLRRMQTKCPDNKPILAENGQCISCLYHHDVQTLFGCDRCPNRQITIVSASPYDHLYTCALKED